MDQFLERRQGLLHVRTEQALSAYICLCKFIYLYILCYFTNQNSCGFKEGNPILFESFSL